MASSQPARTPARRIPSALPAILVVLGGGLIGALASQPPAQRAAPPAFGSSAPEAVASPSPGPSPAPSSTVAPPLARGHHDPPTSGTRGAPGAADGVVRDDVTIFDDEVPAVANLDRALLGALRRAATDAAGDRVTFSVTSGWRSPAYQAQLLREAVATYGSEAAAARWVATPATSPHVSGDAVDMGSSAATWLSRRGAAYGLCQTYGNEPWHYELRPKAVTNGCPPTYADPTHDPRMQR